ncbi:MAG TPA: TIM barrel protein [Planctomycetota bacterium]|nr:TIM barrel protein [Planctomycetota bacterium]
MMDRRTFLAALPAFAAARDLLAAAGPGAAAGRLGLASFSCHLHWKAVSDRRPGIPFTDAPTFYEYSRKLGAEGIQAALGTQDLDLARRLRARVEESGGCYEAELRLPAAESDLAKFENDVRLAREAGALVARSVLLSGRRYETFKTAEEFREFRARGERSLQLAEPVVKKHRLKLAIENHKDRTAPELLETLRKVGSEWVGVCLDLGNNIALLEEPHEVVRTLAPLALSVHLKDMAVELYEEGFLLSEVPLGTGMLDLPEMIRTLRASNPGIVFNLEMATREPLKVPCLTPGYWATFPERPASDLAAALTRLRRQPPKQPLPRIAGKSTEEQLALEEENNRGCLAWAREKLGF